MERGWFGDLERWRDWEGRKWNIFDKKQVITDKNEGFRTCFFFWTTVARCQGLVGHSVRTALSPSLLQLSALLNTGWMRKVWLLWVWMLSVGNIHVGKHIKGCLSWHLKSTPCWQNSFCRAGTLSVPQPSCCSPPGSLAKDTRNLFQLTHTGSGLSPT